MKKSSRDRRAFRRLYLSEMRQTIRTITNTGIDTAKIQEAFQAFNNYWSKQE